MPTWDLLADGVVLLHTAYVAFVVFGLAAIPIGAALGALWVRNFRFRVVHGAAMGLVFLEMLVGILCPLTILENHFRSRAGVHGYTGDFIAHWTHQLIYYAWPSWVFDLVYAGAMLVIATLFLLIPPERRKRSAVG
jgi:ABC-type multidrug transport system permease subunit